MGPRKTFFHFGLALTNASVRQTAMTQEQEPTEITKTIKLPGELWARIEPMIEEKDTDFSKFCRNALRFYLERLTD